MSDDLYIIPPAWRRIGDVAHESIQRVKNQMFDHLALTSTQVEPSRRVPACLKIANNAFVSGGYAIRPGIISGRGGLISLKTRGSGN